jgi:hypothetical protein
MKVPFFDRNLFHTSEPVRHSRNLFSRDGISKNQDIGKENILQAMAEQRRRAKKEGYESDGNRNPVLVHANL